ncbi:uncharacterized protein ACNS7B_008699 [Menidia menidia]
MNKDGDKSTKSAPRSQKQPKAHQQVLSRKKTKDASNKDAQSVATLKDPRSDQWEIVVDVKPSELQGKRAGKESSNVGAEHQRSSGAQRKLSDASNASEDLSKDSGCLSGKLSSSDSSSEISDCSSDGNKRDSPNSYNELSWIDGRAYETPDSEATGDGKPCVKAAADTCAPAPDAAPGGLSLLKSAGPFIDFMMGDTTEDLVREVEDLRSENEYLKDEMEELRCEMLEMRDMFQEEEVYQLQELRLQLEQANKSCRILQYRLRKAERRSIRVAQTGQVDGELVRSLEHDIKVAKSVSLRLYTELEAVQKKDARLEWENEALREKTQQLEVEKQVLQAEAEKARESSLKKRSLRSTVNKAERRLSQQMEDDSADLKCQLHFAKEELALMCKKLTNLVSESEALREELAKYQRAYGDMEGTQSPEGKQNPAQSREMEFKVHLKLVEEEATLLSRRIVELEVENRGLRAEMSDLREKAGGRGGREEEEVLGDGTAPVAAAVKDEHQSEESGEGNGERSVPCNQAQSDGTITACHIAREGPVGGEWDPSDGQQGDDDKKLDEGLKGMTVGDYETLRALRDHSCILTSAIQLLTAASRNGQSSPPSCAFISPTDLNSNDRARGSLDEALELLEAMLVAFIGRLEMLLRRQDEREACPTPPLRANRQNLDGSQVSQTRGEDLSKQAGEGGGAADGSGDSKTRLSLQILWILHQWSKMRGSDLEGKEGRDKTLAALLRLLQELGAELRDEGEAKARPGRPSECAFSGPLPEGHYETIGPKGNRSRQLFPPRGPGRKNWCYLSQEAAQLDREEPFKTWDHPIMPHSFPDLDLERTLQKRSHTAPEKSGVRIYYSPPTARRVQPVKSGRSPVADRGSVDTTSPWCTPPTSFSQLCLGSSANLSDDMKEITAGWRQAVHGGSQERRGRAAGRWVDVACSGTQTHMKPQMVSVGQQTDGAARSSPSRVLGSSLVSARSQHISASLDGIAGRMERSRASTSSPKLYRRHSSLPSPTSLGSTSSSTSSPRNSSAWNPAHQNYSGIAWTRQRSPKSGAGKTNGPASGAKPPSKPAGNNRCGLVTEFLRRVSSRTDKAAQGSGPGQKAKSGLKNIERAPTRPQAATLHRNDSVTRIVNQRFMKQREETGQAPREEKGSSPSPRVRHSQSTGTSEEDNYECTSSSRLSFCFARPSRTSARQTSAPGKLLRHGCSSPASMAADSNCG